MVKSLIILALFLTGCASDTSNYRGYVISQTQIETDEEIAFTEPQE